MQNAKLLKLLLPGVALIVLGNISQAQELQRKLGKSNRVSRVTYPTPVPSTRHSLFTAKAVVPKATQPPAVGTFTPGSGHTGETITVNGANFDSSVTVTIGGVKAAAVTLNSATSLTVMIGAGANGAIVIKTKQGKAQSADDFTYIPPPAITGISPAAYQKGTVITVLGTGFVDGTTVSIDGTTLLAGSVVSPTTITGTVNGPVTSNLVTVSSVNGSSVYTPSTDPNGSGGSADFMLPDPANGFLIIPTPKYSYTQVHPGKKFAFAGNVWGNVLGTDSSMQRVATKLLVPQTSLLGFQADISVPIITVDTTFTLGILCDLNLLLKKISYIDTTSKNNFDPWVFHPRLGLVATFYNNNLYAGFYYNVVSILNEYDAFGAFFKTGGKNTFAFPEFSVGGIFGVSGGGRQQLKIGIDGILNTKNVNMLYGQNAGVIFSVKAGFATML